MPSRVARGGRAVVDFVVVFGWGGFFRDLVFYLFFFFEHTRPAASMMPPWLIHLSASTGVRTAIIYLVCLSVCVTFVVLTDCESCTRPISTKPGSIESGEYGLTRGECSIASRLELHAMAGLLWISWCVLGGADFSVTFFFRFFFSSNAHGLLQV